jgi:hypothetical protein
MHVAGPGHDERRPGPGGLMDVFAREPLRKMIPPDWRSSASRARGVQLSIWNWTRAMSWQITAKISRRSRLCSSSRS